MATTLLTNPGNGSWTVPAGVYSVTIECIGAGGGGGAPSGGGLPPCGGVGGAGGGGGAYSVKNNYSVTPGQVLDVYIGIGGDQEIAGEDTSVSYGSTICLAKGGGAGDNTLGGAGGSSFSCVGDLAYSGGGGYSVGGDDGGGGGGAGGENGIGGFGSLTMGGVGNGIYSGSGGDGDSYPTFGGFGGQLYGGGGGGVECDSSSNVLYAGSQGVVILTYTPSNRRGRPWSGVSYFTSTPTAF